MITHFVGNPSKFAIEWFIETAYASLGQLALGCFVIHVNGKSYGVRKSDATLLACSANQVARRLSRRGMHTASFCRSDAFSIVKAFVLITYARNQPNPNTLLLGKSIAAVDKELLLSEILWAPDGDEAFDDSGHVLQFDDGELVRLIAFHNASTDVERESSVSEIWLSADEFYSTLAVWLDELSAKRIRLLANKGVP